MIDRVTDFTLAGIGLLMLALTFGALQSPKNPIEPNDPRVLAYLESVSRTAGLAQLPLARPPEAENAGEG
jgi:hypothetical protein